MYNITLNHKIPMLQFMPSSRLDSGFVNARLSNARSPALLLNQRTTDVISMSTYLKVAQLILKTSTTIPTVEGNLNALSEFVTMGSELKIS